MANRSTTSEYLPAAPTTRLRSPAGKVGGSMGVKTSAVSGVKPNVGAPPATNGDRASGLAASSPSSATKQLKITPTV